MVSPTFKRARVVPTSGPRPWGGGVLKKLLGKKNFPANRLSCSLQLPSVVTADQTRDPIISLHAQLRVDHNDTSVARMKQGKRRGDFSALTRTRLLQSASRIDGLPYMPDDSTVTHLIRVTKLSRSQIRDFYSRHRQANDARLVPPRVALSVFCRTAGASYEDWPTVTRGVLSSTELSMICKTAQAMFKCDPVPSTDFTGLCMLPCTCPV